MPSIPAPTAGSIENARTLDEPFEIPAEPLPPEIPPETLEYLAGRQAALRLLARVCEARGFTVLPGEDFEENLLRAEHDQVERKRWDAYVRIKLGRSPLTDRARRYVGTVRRWVEPGHLRSLLAICRVCTYAGGPGFPDLLLLGRAKPEFRTLAPSGALPIEQNLFALLATSAGLPVRVVGPGPVRFLPRDLLREILRSERSRAMVEGLERALRAERESLRRARPPEALRIQDEIQALEVERFQSPLGLLQRWLDVGSLRWRDVEDHGRILRASHLREVERFGAMEEELRGDPGFPELKTGPSPEALARCMDLVRERFHLGETRTKALLAYLKDA